MRPALGERCARCEPQPAFERLASRTIGLDDPIGRMAREPGGEGGEPRPLLAHRRVCGSRKTHCHCIEPLGVIEQPPPRVHEPLRQHPDLAAVRRQPAPHHRDEPGFERPVPRRPLVRVGHDGLRRRRGSRCAQIRHEIRDGEVDFVPDSADDGDRCTVHRARHHFFVESPEILQRPPAARQNQYIAIGALAGKVEHARDCLRRPGALDRRGIEHHRHGGKPPSQHAQDVAYRRPGGGGDDPDAPRQGGKRAFVLCVEQAFRTEPALQCIERAPQRSGAGLLHVLHDELELPALGVEADLRVGEHVQPVLRREPQRAVVHAEHRAPHLAVLVLEREVDVPRARAREIGDLALDPHRRERLLENRTGVEVEA